MGNNLHKDPFVAPLVRSLGLQDDPPSLSKRLTRSARDLKALGATFSSRLARSRSDSSVHRFRRRPKSTSNSSSCISSIDDRELKAPDPVLTDVCYRRIFAFLDYRSLGQLASVCKQFQALTQEDDLWRALFHREWPQMSHLRRISFFPSWRVLFRCKKTLLSRAPRTQAFGALTIRNVEYAGEWKDGKLNGIGLMISSDYTLYEGQDGRYEGQGIFTLVTGESYRSAFRDARQVGPVTYSNLRGDRYEGEWKDDKPNGLGHMYYADGTVYVGEWRNGRSAGHGVMIFSKNSQYKGLWGQGRFHGAGVFSAESGDVFAGEWRAGLLLRCAVQHKERKAKREQLRSAGLLPTRPKRRPAAQNAKDS